MSDQATVLEQIDAADAELRRRLDRIDEAHGTWDGAVGDWSVVSLLQHMHGWLTEMNAAVERMQQGQRPTPEGVSYADVDSWNNGFVEQRGAQSYADARAAFEAEHSRFRAKRRGGRRRPLWRGQDDQRTGSTARWSNTMPSTARTSTPSSESQRSSASAGRLSHLGRGAIIDRTT